MNQEKIPFYVDRDFGQTFNTSLKFLRQNLKLFFQSILFISGPFLLISAIAGAYYQASAMQSISMLRSGMFGGGEQFGLMYWLFLLVSMIAQLSMIGTAYAYLITYNEKGPGNFTVSDVGRTLTKHIGDVIVIFLLMLVFIVLGVLILVLLSFIFGSIPFIGVLWVLGLVIGMLILGPPLMWMLNTAYLVKMQEKVNALYAFTRTREVMKGNFWWTWLIVVCSLITVGIVSFIFMLPQSIYNMVLLFGALKGDGDTDVSITFIIISAACTFFATMLYTVLFIVNGFHYYSLAEKKDRKGLINRIDELGNNTKSNVEQHY